MLYELSNRSTKSTSKSANRMGWDVEPRKLSLIGHNDFPQKMTADHAKVSLKDARPHLWNNISSPGPEVEVRTLSELSGVTFVSSIEQGPTTGVLRQHAMRLNSTISCKRLSHPDFPANWNGSFPFFPFSKWYAHSGNSTRVRVPGQHAISPWALLRNRQDIAEHLYPNVLEDLDRKQYPAAWRMIGNYTMHCTAYSHTPLFRAW